jgi:DNA-binding CsgD family transcriptional regulator
VKNIWANHMNQDGRLTRLIGRAYDAALDPTQWISVLGEAARFVGGPSASLYSRDIVRKTGDVTYQSGLEPRFAQLYTEKYIKVDPAAVGSFRAAIQEPVSTTDVMPYEQFIATTFYKEWGRPQGLVDSVHATLEKSATSSAAFAVFRHQRDGLVDNEARRRMRLVVPHIRRAVLIGKVVDLRKAEAATFGEALDGISTAIFFVDATGCIVHANTTAHALLSKPDIVRAANGRLVASDQQTDHILADVFANASIGDVAIGRKGIALPLIASNGEHHVCHVLPLRSGTRRRAGTNYAAVAALFIQRAALDMPSIPEAIAKAYKLTPTELRALLAIVEVGPIPHVADMLGIGAETVKTHLRHVYEKTGASRQVDLAKIVAGFSSPLLN